MAFYRLKHGSHSIGSGANARTYRAKDFAANIVESDQDLAAMMPEKFEYHRGAVPDDLTGRPAGTKRDEFQNPEGKSLAQMRAAARTIDGDQAGIVETGSQTGESGNSTRSPVQTTRDRQQQGEGREQSSQKENQSSPSRRQSTPLDDPTEGDEDGDALDGKTIAELKSIAEDEDVEIHGNMKKQELVNAIREARGG